MAGVSVHGGVEATANPKPGSKGYLKWWWTKGPGLARWRDNPHPWTKLHEELSKHIGPKMADRVTTVWYHAVFGTYPNQGKHKVGHHYV